uniref:Helitron helicase-like domain-containing protein n=1 Tax=Phytophthora ramorum TaxID=164328 RepID=H3GH10_PHYRM
MYDYLATERVKKGVFVRVRHDPNTATRAMHVSAEELRGAMEARVVMRRAARTEKPVTSCEGRNCANSVLKAINASTAKMWGSNEERDSFQRKVNAMTFMYGKPSVFWTLTPYSEGSIAVAFWSGYDLPYKRPTDLAACTVVNLPSTASMKRLTMQNTMLQARYFEMCCKILIEIMFGWDSTQGRLRVHIHGVMWVAGLPKTKTDWEKLLADSTMRARFESYCASILCKQQLTDANVAALVIERKWNELDAEHKAVSTENTACTLRLRFGGLSAHEPTASAQLSRLLQHDQVHAHVWYGV